MRKVKNTMRPSTRSRGIDLRSSKVVSGTTSASMPSGGVPTLPPSEVATSGCGQGATISARASPRIQRGTVTGSARTFCEAEVFERAHRPGDRGRVARRAGEARAHLGGERADEFVGRVVGEGAVAEGAGFG